MGKYCEWCKSKDIEREATYEIEEMDNDGFSLHYSLCDECREKFHAMNRKAFREDLFFCVGFISFFAILFIILLIIYLIFT